tara:strand:- start:72 stop:749 length:678 start_codon:yes stop_codon:yes gene_type:complete
LNHFLLTFLNFNLNQKELNITSQQLLKNIVYPFVTENRTSSSSLRQQTQQFRTGWHVSKVLEKIRGKSQMGSLFDSILYVIFQKYQLCNAALNNKKAQKSSSKVENFEPEGVDEVELDGRTVAIELNQRSMPWFTVKEYAETILQIILSKNFKIIEEECIFWKSVLNNVPYIFERLKHLKELYPSQYFNQKEETTVVAVEKETAPSIRTVQFVINPLHRKGIGRF